ncbi:uncharacterized protein TRUGW13939_11826 [Talaromyces rugulosus]|uniref:Major facilitator superfamily (MFS) profile domain-containing protein n=1 Tax=Talaromyces rugulosus TaxID=121627 RepID=A0A7H8RDU7_TALRU|nr:uncharacterized protein TRUGW13939_11826 [Talaromyces rugulosus]QKX64650.1 hypothetical protein TRUGW13939_11826 [Talaromyces rugulosus]
MNDNATAAKQGEFPTAQLFLLALCRIAEPVALTSVFPYAYDFMQYLLGAKTSNAAFYAGVFIAVFSLAESLTGFWWGALSDRVGRKPVLLLGCGGTMISLFVLGFSSNIWMAVLGRALGGALNGNIGVVQTMVGEMVTRPEHEPRAYAVMPFFFSIGCTLGPAIGGFFASPAESELPLFGKSRLFQQFPYLLPNLICAGMVFLTMLFASVALKETHPNLRHRKTKYVFWEHRHDESSETPLLYPVSSEVEEPSYGATSTGEEEPHPIPASFNPFRGLGINVWMLVAAICLLSSHTVTYIQLLPIFLRDPPDTSVPPHYMGGVGGLGMSLTQVGLVMGLNGIIGLVVQLLFPFFTERVGIQSTLLLVTTLHPISYFCVPYLAFIPTSTWRTIGLYTWLTMRNVFSTFTYPILLIYIKRWTPDTLMLGRVNGLVASAGAACRTVSPAAAGLLQTIGQHHHFSALAWWGSGIVALVAAVQCWFINTPPEEDNE